MSKYIPDWISLPKVSKEDVKFDATDILGNGLLYLGNANDALAIANTPNIRHVVNMAGEIECFYNNVVGYSYLQCLLDDKPDEPIGQLLDVTFNYIEKCIKAKQPVLVHCYWGASRSATIVIAYLMRKYRWSTQKALDFVKQKRCYINPNAGFRKVLEQFEKYNYTQLLPNSKEKTIVIKQS